MGYLDGFLVTVRQHRLFGGKLSPLVAHLAEQEALSPQDIAEIEALLKEMKS